MKSSPLHKGIGKYTKKAKGKRGFKMKSPLKAGQTGGQIVRRERHML